MDQKGRPFCNCTDPLFDGEFCDHYICADYCENGGFCSYTLQENKPTSSITSPPLRKCSCREGFEGEKCEIQSTNCVSKCSSNHSTCTLDIDGRAICHCHPGYQGERCEQCAYDQVCENGGHCIKDHDYGQFRCKCPPGKKEQNYTKKNYFFFLNVQKLIYFSRKKYLFLHQDLLVRGAILIFVIMLNVKMVGLVFLHLMVPNANVLRTSKALFAKTMPAKDIVNMVELPMGNCNHRDTINVIVIVLLVLLDCIAKKIHVLPFNVSMEAIVPSSEAVKYAIAH